ncbi:hypothetical protein BDV93DRAFT_570557 [Ceratobasidium sp. AG-I]|nr:hypothetical protein BDV93DRAFT_570557 [Ceratobasidium sp. AG-I]
MDRRYSEPSEAEIAPGPSLENAATRLAKAAAALQNAAQTITEASEAFYAASHAMQAMSRMTNNGLQPTINTLPPETTLAQGLHSEINETEDTEDHDVNNSQEKTDYYVSERATIGGSEYYPPPPCGAGPMTIEQLRFDPNLPPPVLPQPIPPQEHPGSFGKGRSFHILVNREANILPLVCILSQKYDKIICYMDCGIPELKLYKRLFNDVTGAEVHIPSKTASAELDRLGSAFLGEPGRAIFLLPETAGRLVRLNLDKIQTKAHRAQDSILVANYQDKDVYPSGLAITTEALEWPEDEEVLFALALSITPQFDKALADIPSSIKEKVYPIGSRGSRGRRHAVSWTPTKLVQRANWYLLDALQYGTQDSITTLPQVTSGFVAHHRLESAVQDGVLNVKQTGSDLNRTPGVHQDTSFQRNATPVDEAKPLPNVLLSPKAHEPSGDFQIQASTQVEGDFVRNALDPGEPEHLPLLNSLGFKPAQSATEATTRHEFKSPPRHTYFAVEEEFDTIPLICFIAKENFKVVCFLDDFASLAYYRMLGGTSDPAAMDAAAEEFDTAPHATLLLLPHTLESPPSILKRVSVDYVLYWGYHSPLHKSQKYLSKINCESSSIIITTAQRNKMKPKDIAILPEHPSMALLCSQENHSLLADMREKTESALASQTKTVQNIYVSRVHFFGRTPRKVLSAVELARRVNAYSAKVLLRGDPNDGSKNHRPVGEKFPVPSKITRWFALQPAVDAGLLSTHD